MRNPATRIKVRVWDLPTRLFHWLLALAVALAILTGQMGGNLIDWHGRIGLFIVGLIAFRLIWGFAGSTYARFDTFLPAPEEVFTYLKGEWKGLGHNPLGALSVVALLGLLGLQAGTGLFANDDIAFNGPLYGLVGKDFSDRLAAIHCAASSLLYGLTALHVAAILFHLRIKKDNLLKPMLVGWKELDAAAGEGKSASGGGRAALIVALALAGLAVWGASGAWIAKPVPPPPAATPAW